MTTERTLADDSWVRIMADYSADGVWAKDGAAETADELPISDELRARLRAWQRWFDVEADSDYFNAVGFSEEGRQIALAIKSELPNWTVVYFDEARSRQVPGPAYQYEIFTDGQNPQAIKR
jgi:hypothetical protein